MNQGSFETFANKLIHPINFVQKTWTWKLMQVIDPVSKESFFLKR